MTDMKDFLRRHEPVATIEAAMKNNSKIGGSRVITYGGMEVLVPARDIHLTIDRFRTMGDKYRTALMVSVNHSLAQKFPTVKARSAKPEEAVKCAQDVAIWFANEVIEGRATFAVN